MAFDMGFDYRNTSSFATDPAYGVPVLAEAYPHTYTNGNGDSINAGWNRSAPYPVGEDNASTNDPRIVGDNYTPNNTTVDFQVDLTSGSAPGSGNYTVDMAVNIVNQAHVIEAVLKDNTTALLTLSDVSVAAGHYLDATGTDVTASSSWAGTTTTYTFSSTVARVVLGTGGANFTGLAHFRLTLQSAGAASPRMLMLLGVGA